MPRYADISGTAGVQREIYRRLDALQETLESGAAGDAEVTRLRIWQHLRRGDLALGYEDLEHARELYERALATAEGAAHEHPDDPGTRRDLAACLEKVASLERRAGDLTAARSLLARALTARKGLVAADPTSVEDQRGLADSLNILGSFEVYAGDLPAARSVYGRLLTIRTALAAADRGDARPPSRLQRAAHVVADDLVHLSTIERT